MTDTRRVSSDYAVRLAASEAARREAEAMCGWLAEASHMRPANKDAAIAAARKAVRAYPTTSEDK
jgi:hypothetical protein